MPRVICECVEIVIITLETYTRVHLTLRFYFVSSVGVEWPWMTLNGLVSSGCPVLCRNQMEQHQLEAIADRSDRQPSNRYTESTTLRQIPVVEKIPRYHGDGFVNRSVTCTEVDRNQTFFKFRPKPKPKPKLDIRLSLPPGLRWSTAPDPRLRLIKNYFFLKLK